MFWKAVCDNFGTIIGVVGSISGGVVGWWLNNLSRKGKLSIFVEDGINGVFQTQEGCEPTSLEGADNFYYKIRLEIYNSSADTKIIRDVKVVFYNDKEILLTQIPYDKSLKVSNGNLLPQTHNTVQLINVQAKSAITLDLYGWIDKEDLEKVYKTNMVFLYYKDENNKQQAKLVDIKDYKDYEFYKGEE